MVPTDSPLPPPPVPADADLRDFPFLQLDVLSLRDSALALAAPELFRATLLLWCASWHQVPAASLPDDEHWLAHHCGAGADWPAVRDAVLAGFPLHADGRRYAPMVAAKAVKAWEAKRDLRGRREADRLRKRDGRTAPAPRHRPPLDIEAASATDGGVAADDGPAPDAATPDPATPEAATADAVTADTATIIFNHGLAWLKRSTGKSESHCRGLLGRWRKAFADQGGGDAALMATLGRAQREGVIEPVGWIERALAHHKAAQAPPSASGWN